MKNMTTLQALIRLLKSQRSGSITLEAALVFPLLVCLFVFFYLLIMACSIQMTMKSVAYTSVTSVASQIHAVDEIGRVIKNKVNYDGQVNNVDVNQNVNQLSIEQNILTLLPEPIYSIVVQGKQGNWWPVMNLATTVLGKSLFEKILLELPENRGLNKESLSLVYLQLPDIVNYSDATVKLTLQYEFPFKIPLINKRLVIREQASQRAWLPDSRSNNYAITESDMFIQVISITPRPVRPGNKAIITVRTKPQASLSVNIYYKSGRSVAKNLEVKTANEQGEISWEWHVSGNTTPGIWQYDINDVSGEANASGVFEVKKKGAP